RGRHIETLAIEAELDHLWSAGDLHAIDFGRLVEKATHPHLSGQFGFMRVGDIVLADIAVQPVAEIKMLVVHGDENDRDDARYGNGPLRMWLIFNIHDLFPLPFAYRVLPPMDDIG